MQPENRVSELHHFFQSYTKLTTSPEQSDDDRSQSPHIPEFYLAAVLDFLPIAMFSIDINERITFIDGQVLTRLRVEKEAALGKFYSDVLPDLEVLQASCRAALNGEMFIAEHEMYGLTFMFMFQPIYDSNDNLAGTLCIVRDISEHQLREQQFRGVFDNSFQIMAVLSPEGVIRDVNKSFLDTFRLPYDQAIGQAIWEFPSAMHSDSVSRQLKAAVDVGKTGQIDHRELLLTRPDDSIIALELSVKPVVSESKAVTMLIFEGHDVTDRYLAEQQVLTSQRFLRTVLDNLPVQLFVINRAGVCTLLEGKPDTISILKESKRENISVFETFRDNRDVLDDISRAIDGEAFETIWKIDGRTIETHLNPINGVDGTDYVIGVAMDVTRLISAEEALKHEKRMNVLRSRFISTISHEYRTPLSVILSSTELLHRYGTKMQEEDRDKYYHQVYQQVKLLTSMIDEILLLSQLQSDKFEASWEQVDIADKITAIVEEFVVTRNKTGRIKLTIEEGNYLGKTAPRLFRQIVSNLLSNAIKYTPDNSQINVTLHTTDDTFVISVVDRGIGIPPEEQNNIFSAFHRARNAENIPGTGLGLSIVAQAVDMLQGKITFSSVVGQGTTFLVEVPQEPRLNSD